MDARSIAYLRKLYRNYYERNTGKLQLPPDYPAREFAAQLWGAKSYVRHVSFQSRERFEAWVVEKAPRHLYYSSAVYRYPAAQDMDEKGWIGADLIFDIDADHLPRCEGKVTEIEDKALGVKASFAPSECIAAAAWEATKLLDALVHELGFERSRIRVEFSGHRGFHVTVECRGLDECFESDSEVRRELLNYIRAEALDESLVFSVPVEAPTRGKRRVRIFQLPPRVEDPGIRGRIARLASLIAAKKGQTRLASVFRSAPLEAARIYSRMKEDIDMLLNEAIEEAHIEVDPQVTLDTKRLIRIPYSLHGKTGLPVLPVHPEKLDEFQIDASISPFNRLDPIRIRALVDTPKVEILGDIVKLKKGEVYRLPAPIAIYLMAKEVAVLG